jgi:hypothetical protein
MVLPGGEMSAMTAGFATAGDPLPTSMGMSPVGAGSPTSSSAMGLAGEMYAMTQAKQT